MESVIAWLEDQVGVPLTVLLPNASVPEERVNPLEAVSVLAEVIVPVPVVEIFPVVEIAMLLAKSPPTTLLDVIAPLVSECNKPVPYPVLESVPVFETINLVVAPAEAVRRSPDPLSITMSAAFPPAFGLRVTFPFPALLPRVRSDPEAD